MASSRLVLALVAALWACERSVAAPVPAPAPKPAPKPPPPTPPGPGLSDGNALMIDARNAAFGSRSVRVDENGLGQCHAFGYELDLTLGRAKVDAFLALARAKKVCGLTPVPREKMANALTLAFHAPDLDCEIERTETAWRKDAADVYDAAMALLRDACPEPPPPAQDP